MESQSGGAGIPPSGGEESGSSSGVEPSSRPQRCSPLWVCTRRAGRLADHGSIRFFAGINPVPALGNFQSSKVPQETSGCPRGVADEMSTYPQPSPVSEHWYPTQLTIGADRLFASTGASNAINPRRSTATGGYPQVHFISWRRFGRRSSNNEQPAVIAKIIWFARPLFASNTCMIRFCGPPVLRDGTSD